MTASTGSATITLPADNQILITREFDAPRHLVWEAYTQAEHISRWWAGRRGRVTSVDIDLREGGTWRYVMVATAGHEVAFNGEFREIVPTERIVSTEIYEGAPGGDPAVNTITFSEADGRTTLEILTEVPTKEIRDMILESGMETGMQEGMDILEEIAIGLR